MAEVPMHRGALWLGYNRDIRDRSLIKERGDYKMGKSRVRNALRPHPYKTG